MLVCQYPFLVSSHCNVWLNSTHFLLTGGNSNEDYFRTETLLINAENGEWIFGPSMKVGRHSHGCAKVLIDGKPIIFVTGGKESWLTPGTASVEYLDPADLDKGWMKGLDLPERISSHRMVITSDSKAFIVGGFSGKELPKERHEILEMKLQSQPETCEFFHIPSRLKYPRFGHVVFHISNSLAETLCSEN